MRRIVLLGLLVLTIARPLSAEEVKLANPQRPD